MKINKTIEYALATTLLLGGTYLGTKATLIDEIFSNHNLNLTTGNLKIRLIESPRVRNAKDKNDDGPNDYDITLQVKKSLIGNNE